MIKAILRRSVPDIIRRRIAVAREVYRATHSLPMVFQSQHVIHLSSSAFGGWFTNHRTRWWEYAWVRREILDRATEVKSAAADLGAGKSPIPLVLTKAGFQCTVVDRAQLEELEGSSRGNEWDFVDYTQWGIRTIRAGMEEPLFPAESLGLIVSVSVVEHLKAETRRLALQRIAAALEPGGYAILTVDLLPGSRNLWNRVVDEIEPVEAHGTLDEFLAEAAAAGLWLERLEYCPVRIPTLDAVGLVLKKER